MKTTIARYTSLLALCFAFAQAASGQNYSKDYGDIERSNVYNKITPIGDLGDLRTIIDLRGFMPFSTWSKAKGNDLLAWDRHKWFQLATEHGVALMYYGDWTEASVKKVSKAEIVPEKNATGDNLQWTKFAYELVKSAGPELFKSAGGTSGLEASEPVAILLNDNSAFVLVNFRYSSLERTSSTGQVMCALEFSRSLKTYKTFYRTSETFMTPAPLKQAFDSSLPFVAKAASMYLTGH